VSVGHAIPTGNIMCSFYTIGSSTKAPALAILDLHNPEIGIEADLLVQPTARPWFHRPNRPIGRGPDQLALAVAGLIEQQAGAVQPRQGEDHRARLFGALAHDEGGCARDLSAPDQGAARKYRAFNRGVKDMMLA